MQSPGTQAEYVFEVDGLSISLSIHGQHTPAVCDVGFAVAPGKTLALVGESGCGKSLTALSILNLLPPQAQRSTRAMRFEGAELSHLNPQQWRALRGARMGMIFQESMTALNPVLTAGQQIAEVVTTHEGLSRPQAQARAVAMLDRVGMPEPERCARTYPHQLSGGMRQRVMIAAALVCQPALLIADEPTTALDVTVQAQVLQLIAKLQADMGTAVIFITHDLGVVAQVADEVAVMYAGSIVEQATTQELFAHPKHPYTQGLFAALPKAGLHASESPLQSIPGQVPPLGARPLGCTFAPRCPHAQSSCSESPIPLVPVPGNKGHRVACPVLVPSKPSSNHAFGGEH